MKVFLVNLEKNKERLSAMDEQLKRLNVPYERIDAIYGKELSPSQLHDNYSKIRSVLARGYELNLGEIGCALSHISIYKRMVTENIGLALVLEDDLVIGESFLSIFEQVEAFLDKDKRQVVVFTGLGGVEPFSSGIHLAPHALCTDAYCITLAAARTILKANYPVFTPADSWRRWGKRFGLLVYRAYPVTVAQDGAQFGTEIRILDKPFMRNGRWITHIGWKIWRFLTAFLDYILWITVGR